MKILVEVTYENGMLTIHLPLGVTAIVTPGNKLTVREEEILPMIQQGLSNKEIAEKAHIAVRTVKHHVRQILTKFDCETRFELARRFTL